MQESPDSEKLRLPELCEKIFRADGYAACLPNFEHRPEQELMARACAQAFAADTPLLFEAGTGVGKSMAYLVTGIIAAVRFGRQLVVSTHTIALQKQIIEKDLPRIREMFRTCDSLADCANFKEALLLGRANYLCTHRLKRALAEKRELFNTDESRELERIADWASITKTGLVEELDEAPNEEVWTWVNADASSCSPKNCGDDCFYQRARRAVVEADVIVLNHNLLFSMLGAGMDAEEEAKGILFANDMLVLDEAHLAPDVAAECFGIGLSSFGVARELKRVYDPKKKRGLITRRGMAEFRDKQIVCEALDAAEDFFETAKADFLTQRDTVRLTSPDWGSLAVCDKLETLARCLDTFAQNAQTDAISSEIKDYKRKIVGIKNSIESCVCLADTDSVYWMELAKGKIRDGVRLFSAPIDVSKILRKKIFLRDTAAIMTSATLAIDSSMDAFAKRVGGECAEMCICKSPFDYRHNMKVFVDTSGREPDRESKKMDCKNLAKTIERLAAQNEGGTLVLFTSYYELNKCAEILQSSELLRERNIYVQGKFKRSQAIKDFARDGNAILLGTDTFWTGIDVPGDALSQVIITKLPFENFKHPLAEAKMERAEALGENPFTTISLPNAIIKFRQGVGRLIRSKTDKGKIVVLDSRIVAKHYGLKFVSALPNPNYTKCDSENIFDRVNGAFEDEY